MATSVATACVIAMLAAQCAPAQDFKLLYTFTGGADGGSPEAGLIQDAKGNLYGTTDIGGSSGYGTVFKLDARGKETVLYSFKGGADGAYPVAGVIQDLRGNLYGTTNYGGVSNFGTVFKLSKTGKETVLHSFKGGADGANPAAGVIPDDKGNLYGTTTRGGGTGCDRLKKGALGCGTVFELSKTGKETVLYSFTGGADGANPVAGVIQDAKGNLYGATYLGGDLNCNFGNGCGTLFKLSKTGVESVLYSFTGGADGANPLAGVIQDAKGNLYGTTDLGGDLNCNAGNGCGTLFKLSKTVKQAVLYSFTGVVDGAGPNEVIQDAKGNLYGTANWRGVSDNGTVFKLSRTGKETLLHSFTGGDDGGYPLAGVIQDAQGNLYGTTGMGGAYGYGVVFKLTP